MNKEIFKNYADIKNQIKELTEQAKQIEISVVEEMQKEEVEEVKSDFGTFFFTKRKTWKYPKAITEAENNIKIAKKEAEENGDATFEEKQSLTFRGK